MYPVFMLLMTIGLVWPDDPRVISLVTLGFALFLLLSRRSAIRARAMPFAMFAAAAVILLNTDLQVLEIVGRTRGFSLTVLMIVAISLIGVLLKPAAIVYLYARIRDRFRSGNENSMLLYSSVVTAPLLNMATPVIYGAMFRNGTDDHDVNVANNVKHGMMIAMLVAPTFAPIALVIGAHPGVHWFDTLIYSLPIALFTLIYFIYTGNSVFRLDMGKAGSRENSGIVWILVYLGLMAVFLLNDLFNVVVSIILAAEITLVLAVLSQPPDQMAGYYRRIDQKCREVLHKINNEALIFIASGVLLMSIAGLSRDGFYLQYMMASLDTFILVPVILLVLPLLSMAKLHPVIGFTLVQPLVYLNQELAEIQKYMLWVCYWAIALQISPISVINITTSNAFEVRESSLTTLGDFMKIYVLGVIYSLFIIVYGGYSP